MKKLLLFGAIVFSCVICSNKPLVAQPEVDLYLDSVNVYVSPYGRISIWSLPPTDQRQLYRTSLLVGTAPDAVFDLTLDLDFEDSTQLLANPTYGDYEIYGSYNNNFSGAPPNVLEIENIYCWQNLNSFIVKYTVINREATSIDAIVGLEFLPRIENNRSGGDTVTYSTQSNIISAKNIKAVGFKPLSENLKSLAAFYYYTGYEADTLFYNRLTYNSFDTLFFTDPNAPNVDAPALIPAFNSKIITPGDSVVFYIALAYGVNEASMLASLEQAQQKYNQLTSVESDFNNIPSDFVLEQNYPNPFNPSTKISFGLPHSSNVVLKIFNLLGEEVAELVNESLEAGTHSYNFDASKLTSGIYIYSLQTDAGVFSKKMTLVK
jgi:hypothetical protein